MLFSIIIPGFNCSETIYNAISSIVDQNYLDLEIIYCDDCSEDDSVNVVKRIANKNKSIKINNDFNTFIFFISIIFHFVIKVL